MDGYKVIVVPAAEKQIAAIDSAEIRHKIDAKILRLAAGPRAVAGCQKLVDRRVRNAYRIRQNNYRIVFTVDKKTRTVHVTRVESRDQAYKDPR